MPTDNTTPNDEAPATPCQESEADRKPTCDSTPPACDSPTQDCVTHPPPVEHHGRIRVLLIDDD